VCECIKTPNIIAGWKCCACPLYNGMQRERCRSCGRQRCRPLSPDSDTGEVFESYEEAYKDDPGMLVTIHEQLARGAQ
jgi:hypothetical protein